MEGGQQYTRHRLDRRLHCAATAPQQAWKETVDTQNWLPFARGEGEKEGEGIMS